MPSDLSPGGASGATFAVRAEAPGDIDAIRDVNRRAFSQDLEGRIVDELRANGALVLSLVAVQDDRVIGHIAYSPLVVGETVGAALGPMAVVPESQRRGVGTALVEAGNRELARGGCPFVGVLGHPGFYPRFGFRPASTCGIRCPWEVADETFMVLPLDARRMAGVAGTAQYRPEFSAAEP
jgi:putative acetyltransferase